MTKRKNQATKRKNPVTNRMDYDDFPHEDQQNTKIQKYKNTKIQK
jgi:hypothetical protein